MWAKEWRMMMWPSGVWAMALAWLVVALFLLSYLEEYQAIAIQLAGLNNRRGATEMLLVPVNGVLTWLMVLWSVYFGARGIALERQWQTEAIYLGSRRIFWRLLSLKIASLMLAMILITLPFWVFIGFLFTATEWDTGLMLGLILAQGLMVLYATLLSLAVSATQNQALIASLFVALIWLLLWVAPTLTTEPAGLVAMLRWLSPFEHIALLEQGMLSGQTLVFLALHLLFFLTLIPVYWVKDY